MAVECRDYTRQQNIQWVDQLIGKYKDLKVNKIIAVSSSEIRVPWPIWIIIEGAQLVYWIIIELWDFLGIVAIALGVGVIFGGVFLWRYATRP
jgi:hypothetical protein